MPAFAYRAVDAAGTPANGVIEASSPAAARALLRERALLPTAIAPAAEARAGFSFGRNRLSPRHLATVTRQISTLVSSDIAVEEALRLVAAQAEGAKASAVLLAVRAAILDGLSFAAALGRQPAAFPEFYRASVAAGERSGKLADVLAHLADFVEARHRTAQKLQLALMYPALLACVSFGMMALLLVYVVPDIVRVFVSRGAELPFLTRALIAVSSGMQAWGAWLLAAVLLVALAGGRWMRSNRLAWHRFLSETPPFRRFSRQHNAARFAASLATLVQSDVALMEALHASAAVTPNHHVRAATLGVAARVREGATLRGAMAESGVFPSMLVAIVASGETGGRLGPALGRAAAELERELDALVATMVALVEPAVLLLMGGLVLLMVLAILLPIINLNNLVGM